VYPTADNVKYKNGSYPITIHYIPYSKYANQPAVHMNLSPYLTYVNGFVQKAWPFANFKYVPGRLSAEDEYVRHVSIW
jgi:hypothetical protein